MRMSHPHLGATYELVDRDDVTAEVIVTIPDMRPTTVKGFATKALAKKWIKRHKESVAAGSDPRKPKFRRCGATPCGAPDRSMRSGEYGTRDRMGPIGHAR